MVSVIIPTYNNSKYITEAINSVLSQSCTDLECIVIDDGSTDNTKEILHNFIQSKKIFYYYQENTGVSAARNLGIQKSKGTQILFLDADDLLNTNALKSLLNNIGSYDIIFGAWEDFGNIMHRKNLYLYIDNNKLLTYLKYKPVPSAALIKKNSLERWDEDLKVWEVTDFFLHIILNGAKVTFINDTVTKMRQHNGPHRASIIQDHFHPLTTLPFLKKWKTEIKCQKMLCADVETLIDEDILSNINSAIRMGIRLKELKIYFKEINIQSLKTSQFYKPFGLYYFIYHLKSINTMFIFNKIDKYFGK
jgi:glycosyltransferase involved in cell wall biosynthesis